VEKQQHQPQEEEGLDPLSLYQYAIKSPVTRDKHQRRLATFFKFIGMTGNLEDQARIFAQRGRLENGWALNSIVRFIQFQRERVNAKFQDLYDYILTHLQEPLFP
jgi:hypothetical protein